MALDQDDPQSDNDDFQKPDVARLAIHVAKPLVAPFALGEMHEDHPGHAAVEAEADAHEDVFNGNSQEAQRKRHAQKISGEGEGLNHDASSGADPHGRAAEHLESIHDFGADLANALADAEDAEFDFDWYSAEADDAYYNGGKTQFGQTYMAYEDAQWVLNESNVLTVSRSYDVDSENKVSFTHAVYGDAKEGYYYMDVNNNKVAISKEEIDRLRQLNPQGQTVSEMGYPVEVDIAAYDINLNAQKQLDALRNAAAAQQRKSEAETKISEHRAVPGSRTQGNGGVASEPKNAAPAPAPLTPEQQEKIAEAKIAAAAPGIARMGSISESELADAARKMSVSVDALAHEVMEQNPNMRITQGQAPTVMPQIFQQWGSATYQIPAQIIAEASTNNRVITLPGLSTKISAESAEKSPWQDAFAKAAEKVQELAADFAPQMAPDAFKPDFSKAPGQPS